MKSLIYFSTLSVIWIAVWGPVFWLFRSRRTLGPLLARMTAARWTVLFYCMVAVPVGYCLAYVPFLRLLHDYPGLRPALGGLEDLFVPVQWVFDNTPLQRPLLEWADIWNYSTSQLTYQSQSRLRILFWGTTPPWLYAIGWLVTGLICVVLPPYCAEKAFNKFQTSRNARIVVRNRFA